MFIKLLFVQHKILGIGPIFFNSLFTIQEIEKKQ